MRHESPVTPGEWRRALAYALFVVVVTTLPYLAAWQAQGDGWQFGGFLFGVEDGHSYLGKMRLGARGEWDFHLFYTPEPHASAPLVFLPYILPGQLVGLFVSETDPHLTPILAVVFHLLRVVFDVGLVVGLYRFIAAFLHRPGPRLLALALATFGGGLGWLLALSGLNPLPPEFYIPEAFSYHVLFGLPHLALARAALLGGLLALMRAQNDERWLRPALLAGAAWLVVGLAVPFYLVIVYVILGAWGLALWLRQRSFPAGFAARAAVASGITLPLFAYFTYIFTTNTAFARWSAQNQLPAPSPLNYALAYLPLLIPAILGLRRAWRRTKLDGRFALLVGWPLLALPLVYLPVNVQRRMGEAVIVPLAILASGGLYAWARTWAIRRPGRLSGPRFRRTAVLLVVAASLSSLLLLFGSFGAATNRARPLFRPAEELAAFQWLSENGAPGEVVLAAPATGNALPAYTNLRVVMGHGPETLDWPEKTATVERFYGGRMSADERAALYETYAIRYVVYGPLERALAPDASTDWSEGLQLVYDAGGYAIYRN